MKGKNPYADPDRSKKKAKDWVKAVLEIGGHVCGRCGSKDNLQADHIKGWRSHPELRYDINNGRIRCSECHKFETTLKEIQIYLDYEIERGQKDRIEVYQRRKEILIELNRPERIARGGKYKSYWADKSIRYLPRQVPKQKESELENIINGQLTMAMEDAN